jgi:hypothetical protein
MTFLKRTIPHDEDQAMGPLALVHADASEGARLRSEGDGGDGHTLPSVRAEMAGRLLEAARLIAVAAANSPSPSIRNELKQAWDRLVEAGLTIGMGDYDKSQTP